jgi:adhesin transport system membrane fusion protein
MSDTTEASLVTCSSDLPALRVVGGLRSTRVLAQTLTALTVLIVIVLALVPWQQNVRGAGRVVAFLPYDRMQTIAAPVVGKIRKAWVAEGSRVKQGDPLLEIVDNDPSIVARLDQQRASLGAGLSASEAKVAVYDEQVRALEEARTLAISAAKQHIEMAQASVISAQQGLNAALAGARQATLNYSRQKDLFAEGLASRATFEVAERSLAEANAKTEQARQKLAGAGNATDAKTSDLGRVDTEAKAKIDSARALREQANVEVASKQQQVSVLNTKISQQSTQLLRAQRDGTVFRLLVSPGAELVKAGDPLLILVPDTESRAVEIWVDGNDVPLIHPGRPVRIQFEGWPAVQFAGWPSVAVGTFGGIVKVVDNSDDGAGRFRILISPDPDDDPWPAGEYLRQGARAKGFVLLDEVSLGYELWRQANGFPPAVRATGTPSKIKGLKK